MNRNHLEGFAKFQVMWANRHYVTHVVVVVVVFYYFYFILFFYLYVLGDNLESNPKHEQEVQELEFYNFSVPIYWELAEDADVVLWIFLKFVAPTTWHP